MSNNTFDFRFIMNTSDSTLSTREIGIGRLPDNKRWKLTFRLEYSNGFLINTSTPKEFSKFFYLVKLDSFLTLVATFDVKNGSLMVMSSLTGRVCFICHFVYGSQAKGCFIEYKCTRTDFNGDVTIARTSVNTSIASKCVTGIYTSNYNVTFYDVEHSNNIYKDAYAVKQTNQPVIGLYLTPTSILSSVPSSTDVISMSPSPTTLCCDNSKLLLIL